MATKRGKRKAPKKEYVLKLYITGATRRSQRAVTNLTAICEKHLKGRYDLEVLDIYQTPLVAREAEIVAVPTLVKQLPRPARRLIGDLSQRGRVLLLLDVKEKVRTNGEGSAVPKETA